MLRFTKLVRTCSACPSQWDAYDEDGRYYYIRYRSGWLTVGPSAGRDYDEVYAERIGGEYDGSMEADEMLRLIGAELVCTAT